MFVCLFAVAKFVVLLCCVFVCLFACFCMFGHFFLFNPVNVV